MTVLLSRRGRSIYFVALLLVIMGLLVCRDPTWASDFDFSNRPLDFSENPSETSYLVLTFDGSNPTSMLLKTLGDLQYTGHISVIDLHFGENSILVQSTVTEVEMIRALEGITKVSPIDLPPHMTDDTLSVTDSETMALANTGAITGTVAAEDTGLPIPWVDVYVYPADSYNSVGNDYTNKDGVFSVDGLAAGNYILHFTDGDQYAFEWYNNKLDRESADLLTVTDGMTTSISIQLAHGGKITGVVTAEDTGLPLGEIDVWAYYESGDSYGTDTREEGSYSISGLAAGSYTVCFRDYANGLYAPECYDDKPYYRGGDTLSVTGGVTLNNINASLARAATITGTVINAATGDPLSNVTVGAYTLSDSWSPMEDATTDVSGTYRISDLAPGEYKLKFTDNDGEYLETYYDGQETFAAANPVTLTAGMTTTVDMALNKGGRISGRVVDVDTGTGIGGVSISVSQMDGSSYYASTDASGYYTTSALFSGVYRVRFSPPAPYLEEYYDNLFDAWNDFTPVIVNAPSTTEGINAALSKGYMITGTITGESAPIAGVHVRPYQSDESSYSWGKSDYTAGDGTYAVGPLEPGSYRLAFVPPSESSYAFQWYSDSNTYAGATTVAVPHITSINAELTRGSRITGVVTGPDDLPLSGVYVNIYEAGASTSSLAWGVSTDASGKYLSPGLSPGQYQVEFYSSQYADQWYDGQSAQGDADVITVTAGVTRTNVNAQLETSNTGAITGTITAADTGQLVGVNACLYEDNPEEMFCGGWARDGEFTISGWEAGKYYLYFDAPAPYAPVFYKDAYTPEEATPITITANMTTANVNQVLKIGGSITGTATITGSGLGAAGTKVELSPVETVHVMGGPGSWSTLKTHTTYVGHNGVYRMDGLPAGKYNVEFVPPAPYVGQAYESTTRSHAVQQIRTINSSPISVKLGEVTPDINAVLEEGSVITGVVTAADGGQPLPGAGVEIYSQDQELIASTSTDMDGVYTTPGLLVGEYKMLFSSGSDHLSEWNGDATSFDTASAISVPKTGAVPDVNAALSKGGTFSGFTYDKDTGLLLPRTTVEFYDAGDQTLVGTAQANRWGYYKTDGLQAGQYKAVFTKTGYITRWYNDADRFENATPIEVSLAHNVSGVNSYLSATGYEDAPMMITKFSKPEGQVDYGDELTYTLVISAEAGTQLGLYDPLTGTTFLRFVEQPTGIDHDSNVITGTLEITPTNQVTVSFVAQVGVPGTLGGTMDVSNRACVYPVGGTIEGDCIWSDEVTNEAFHPYNIFLPLVLRE